MTNGKQREHTGNGNISQPPSLPLVTHRTSSNTATSHHHSQTVLPLKVKDSNMGIGELFSSKPP